MHIHPQMYTRLLSTQTGTGTKRQKGGRTSLFTAFHKHTLTRRDEQVRHSKYAERICEMQSYLHIHLYSDKWKKHKLGPPARPIHKVLKSGSTDLRPGLPIVSES